MSEIYKDFRIDTSNHKRFRVIMEQYNSAYDVADNCNTRQITDSSFHNQKTKTDYGRWEGVRSYDEAIDLLKNGYVDKVDTIKKAIDKSVQGYGKRITFSNDIVGYAPIVPLAILGVPTSMINSKMKPIKAKVLDVYYDVSCPASRDSDDILKVGIGMLKVLCQLEMQGYRINLHSVQTYVDRDIAHILDITLKNANQPLDLKRISYPLIHTAFFRVIGFDWYSKVPNGKHIWGYGHNIGHEFEDKEYEEAIEKLFGKNSVYLCCKDYTEFDDKELEDKLKEAVINGCKSNNT